MTIAQPASIFLASFFIIAFGWFIRRIGLVTRGDGGTLARIVINVTLPALILVTVPDITFAREYLLLPFVAIVHSVLAMVVIHLVFGRRPAAEKGLIAICLIGFNNGLFAFPIIRQIFGFDGVRVLTIFDIGNGLMIFGLNYVLAAWYGARAARESEAKAAGNTVVHEPFHLRRALGHVLHTIVTSVPMVTFAVALVLNVTGWRFPGPIEGAVEIVAAANGALALLVLGIFQELGLEKGDLRMIIPVLIVRYTLGAVVAVGAVAVLGTTPLLRDLLAIATILPIGMTTIAFSYEHGLNARLATSIVNITNLISFAVMWVLVVT